MFLSLNTIIEGWEPPWHATPNWATLFYCSLMYTTHKHSMVQAGSNCTWEAEPPTDHSLQVWQQVMNLNRNQYWSQNKTGSPRNIKTEPWQRPSAVSSSTVISPSLCWLFSPANWFQLLWHHTQMQVKITGSQVRGQCWCCVCLSLTCLGLSVGHSVWPSLGPTICSSFQTWRLKWVCCSNSITYVDRAYYWGK